MGDRDHAATAGGDELLKTMSVALITTLLRCRSAFVAWCLIAVEREGLRLAAAI